MTTTTTLRDRLRDADPIRLGPPPDDDRARVRQQVLAAARTDSSGGRPRSPAVRRRTVFLMAIATLAGVVAGSRLWTRGGTTLQAAVRFEARLAEVRAASGLESSPIAGKGESVYLHQDVTVSNADVADARVVPGADADHFGVTVRFTADGARKMREATADHLGRPIAILIDGQIVAAPILRSAIEDTALISGEYTHAEAERIANGITR
jgi:hypothetical protein